MRAASVYGDLLYLDETKATSASTSSPTQTYVYKVRDQPAAHTYTNYIVNSYIAVDCQVTSPYRHEGCDDPTTALDIEFEEVKTIGNCQAISYRIAGNWETPYYKIDSMQKDGVTFGNIYRRAGGGAWFGENEEDWPGDPSDKRMVVDYSCPPGQTKFYIASFEKLTSFDCPPNFIPITDGSKAPPNVDLAHLCRATGPFPTITGRVKQTKTCPAGPNPQPCHPATGDKSRSETDFEFSGRPFTRYYHSLGQFVDKAGFPVGWTHTYSERYASNGSLSWIVTSDGYYETFTSIGGSRYRLDNSSDRILDKLTDTGLIKYRITSSDGEIHDFDSQGRLVAIRNPSHPERDVTLAYNSQLIGKDFLETITDTNGRVLKFEYDTPGLISRAILPDGSIISYEYDSYENLVAVDYGNGVRKEYFYHETGLADPIFRNYLTGISYEDGQRYASFGYDSTGRVKSSQLHGPSGYVQQTTLTYDTADKVTATLPPGGTRTYTMQPGVYRRPLSIAGGPDATVNTYETDGRLKTRTYANGATSSFAYQSAYQSGTTEAVGTSSERKTIITRDAGNRLTRRELYGLQNGVQTLQQVELRTYDTNGRETASCLVDPAISGAANYVCGSQANAPNGVRQTRTTYCEAADVSAGICPIAGLVTAVDGPRIDVADITTYTYYASDSPDCATAPTTCQYRKGDLWKVTNALNHATETLRYDSAGRPLSVKDVNGVVTDLEYHPRGWLTARKVRGADGSSESDDLITRIEYWPTSLVKQVTDPDGVFTTYTYDTAHRLTSISDSVGNKIHYTLDSAGNRIQEDTKDAGGALRHTLSRVYNQLNQLQTAKDADNHATSLTYDGNGNSDTIIDALSRVTDSDYDPLNRLTRTLQDVGGTNVETKFSYDTLDNLTKVVDPKGLETGYAYNGLTDLTRLTSPDTGITDYTYDNAGNRKAQTDARGVITTYNYDALNRLTRITYPDVGLSTSYIYDAINTVCGTEENVAIGRLSRMTDASGSTDYCYDRFGHLTRKVQTIGSRAFSLRYAYTKAGQLRSVTYPDGTIVDYVRNGLAQVIEIGITHTQQTRQVLLDQATYAPFGPSTGWTYGNGRSLTRAFNQNYQPTTIYDNTAGGLSLHYSFDSVGNITQLDNADQTATLARYGYDALSRLTDTKDGPTGAVIEHYKYDPTGNRSQLINSNGVFEYTYPAGNHRLANTGVNIRTYDEVGNTLSIDATKEFVYDDTNRMSYLKINGTTVMSYSYNGLGEQVRKSHGADNTYTLYDEAGHWLGNYDNNGIAIQQAIWLDDLPVGLLARLESAQSLHFLEPDHLGAPRVVIDAAQNTAIWVWDIKGEVFGNSPPNEDPDGNAIQFKLDMRFPGQLYDAASGLNQNWYRDYDPATGRYVESDPIGLNGGISTYGYVLGNPMIRIDPLGLACIQNFRSGGEYEGPEKRIPGAEHRYFSECKLLPAAAPPGPIDFFPDPLEYMKRRFPFSIPVELWRLCSDYYYRRTKVMKSHVRITEYFDVCTDECGKVTIKTPHGRIQNVQWQFGYNENEFWTVYNLLKTNGETFSWESPVTQSSW